MQFTQTSPAKMSYSLPGRDAYTGLVKRGFTHARIGSFAMIVQKFDTPNTVLVSIISDIIAPLVNAATTALISLSTRLNRQYSNRPAHANSKPLPLQAPHVALVMVPGNYVTEPFSHR